MDNASFSALRSMWRSVLTPKGQKKWSLPLLLKYYDYICGRFWRNSSFKSFQSPLSNEEK